MLPDSSLSGMRVMLATPCAMSIVAMNYTTSIYTISSHAQMHNMNLILKIRAEALVTRGRNMLVRDFLSDERFTHLFFIDSDIEFSPQDFFRIILADRDIAAGIYPMKKDNWPKEGLPAGMTREQYDAAYASYPYNPIGRGSTKVSQYVDEDGFVEIEEAPTGFMCIKRHVFYKLMDAYPNLQYSPDIDDPDPEANAHLYWRFFDCTIDPVTNRYVSEDFSFCRLWSNIGGKFYADLHSNLSHHGHSKFKGNLRASLQAKGLL